MPDNVGILRADDSASNPEHAAPEGRETLPRVGDWRSIGEVIARQVAPEVARRVREKQVEGGE